MTSITTYQSKCVLFDFYYYVSVKVRTICLLVLLCEYIFIYIKRC